MKPHPNFRTSNDKGIFVQFSDDLPTVSACMTCRLVSLSAHRDEQGHVFCSYCIKHSSSHPFIFCGSCQRMFAIKQLQDAYPEIGFIARLTVYCINRSRGCEEMMELEKLEDHIASCELRERKIPCEFCGKTISTTRKEKHEERCRGQLRKKCVECGEEIAEGCSMEEHLNECSAYNAACPRCKRIFPKDSFTGHIDTCLRSYNQAQPDLVSPVRQKERSVLREQGDMYAEESIRKQMTDYFQEQIRLLREEIRGSQESVQYQINLLISDIRAQFQDLERRIPQPSKRQNIVPNEAVADAIYSKVINLHQGFSEGWKSKIEEIETQLSYLKQKPEPADFGQRFEELQAHVSHLENIVNVTTVSQQKDQRKSPQNGGSGDPVSRRNTQELEEIYRMLENRNQSFQQSSMLKLDKRYAGVFHKMDEFQQQMLKIETNIAALTQRNYGDSRNTENMAMGVLEQKITELEGQLQQIQRELHSQEDLHGRVHSIENVTSRSIDGLRAEQRNHSAKIDELENTVQQIAETFNNMMDQQRSRRQRKKSSCFML